jgi:peptidoglycan/LPS O-acetylase OafA/YrhL
VSLAADAKSTGHDDDGDDAVTDADASDADAPGAPGAGPRADGAGTGDRLPYVPGLDGLRALALVAVLAFHQGFGWARGGFLGVSSFFTLSGFLIATLALAEWSGTGRLAVGRFWERRARRLLPAALTALAGVAVLQATLGIGSAPTFRGDLLASLGYVANWRFVATTGDYARLFSDPSPVTHMWSLAIEEQFYLAFPLVFSGVMLLVGRGRQRWSLAAAGAAWALLAAASFASAWVLARGGDTSGLVYYATFTRAGELLVGVVLACAFVAWRRRHRGGDGSSRTAAGTTATTATTPTTATTATTAAGRAVRVGGVLGVGGLVVLWHATTLGSPRLFQGLTVANAGLTALVILATTAGGPVAWVLGRRPLRLLGQISYGAYLYHWPIYLVLDAERTGIGHPGRLFAVRVAATVAVAAASYALIESPVRFRLPVPRPRLAALLGGAAVAVVVLTAVLPVREPAGAGLPSDAQEMGWTVSPATPGATRVLLLGDSLAWSLGPSFRAWNDDVPSEPVAVEAYTPFGCPAGGLDVPLRINGHRWRGGGDCADWHDHLADIVARADADVIVFSSGVFEMGERQFAGDWYHLGDPPLDRWLRERLAAIADVLAAGDVPVVWATHPHIRMHDPTDATVPWSDMGENDPARVDRLNEIVDEVIDGRPGFDRVGLDEWTRDLPGGEFDPGMRDGVHYSWEAAQLLAGWLAPQVIAAASPAGEG